MISKKEKRRIKILQGRELSKKLKPILVALKTDQSKIYDLMDLMKDRFTAEANKYLGDHHEAESAVNFVFFKLCSKAWRYTEDRPALPYAISVLRNYCRDILRKRKKTIKTVSLETLRTSE